jgi:uncharacterized protein (TIGR00369 family)
MALMCTDKRHHPISYFIPRTLYFVFNISYLVSLNPISHFKKSRIIQLVLYCTGKQKTNHFMDLSQLHKSRDLAVSGKWKEIEQLFNKSGQLKHMGARVDLSQPECPVAMIDEISDIHKGGFGSDAVHGGIIAALADLALGLLGLLHYKDGMTATAQITVHYLKPFRSKSITAKAITQKVVGNRIFGTVELFNDKDEVCAIAYGALAKGISM